MTAAEAIAVTLYIAVINTMAGAGGVYSTLAVGAGAVLLAGLLVENAVVFRRLNWTTLSLAVTEVVIWTQWANLVTLGMWSRRGIGPAFVVLAVLLTLQHAVETNLIAGESLQLRHAVTAVVEAMAATVGWVLFTAGEPLAAAVAVFALLGIEHATRMSDV